MNETLLKKGKVMANKVMQYLSSLGRTLRNRLNPEETYHSGLALFENEILFEYQKVIENIRLAGWKVFITHKRVFPALKRLGEEPLQTRAEFEKLLTNYEDWLCPYSFEVSPRGGFTIVTLVSPEGVDYNGRADCSFADVFSRKEGRELALQRCLVLNDLKF